MAMKRLIGNNPSAYYTALLNAWHGPLRKVVPLPLHTTTKAVGISRPALVAPHWSNSLLRPVSESGDPIAQPAL